MGKQHTQAAAIKPAGIGMQIAAVLEERILQNVYPIGSKLPPERQLAAEFGVSRQSLRSALNILATRGMLHTRQGDGHYVSERVDKTFQYGWESLIDTHTNLEAEVLDFRRGIEGMLAALAAQRRTEADLARMRRWLVRLQQAYARHDLDQQSAADAAFHQSVADAAHNILFTRLSDGLLRLLTGQTRRNLGNMFGTPDMHAQLMAQHEAIFAAIEQKDPAAARQAAHQHLDYVKHSLQRRREQQAREMVSQALAASDRHKLD